MQALQTIKATGEPITMQVASVSKLFWAQYLQSSTVAIESPWIKSLDSFALELFHRIYYNPEPEWLSPLQPEHQWALTLHEQVSKTSEFLNLIDTYNGDPLMSAIATHETIQALVKSLESAHPQRQPVGDLSELRQQARAMKARREDTQEISQFGQEIVNEAQELAQNLEQGLNGLELAIAQAQEQAQNMSSMMAALGYGDEAGTVQTVPAEERLAIAQKLAKIPKLKEIALIAGRALETAYRKRRQTQATNSYGELVGITVGNDLSQILPQELARLSQSQQKLSFFRDYLEGQLFQNELEAPKEQGRGEMIICVDESDSMEGINESWAKGLTLALITLAHDDQRSVSVIRFSDTARQTLSIAPGDKEKAINHVASSVIGGGTNFERPIQQALSIIEENRKTDLIFITDGIAPLSQATQNYTKEILEETESNFFFLQIGGDAYLDLEAIADHAWQVNPDGGFDNIDELFIDMQL